VGVVGLFHELIRLGGTVGARIVFKTNIGAIWGGGFDWKQHFLLQKFPPMTNPLPSQRVYL
jgi:hypothetical protein